MGAAAGKSFDEISERLDQIIAQVRSKDTSLERSLDLFDEAIELGSQAVEMVDSLDLSPAEEEELEADGAGVDGADAGDAPAAASVPAGSGPAAEDVAPGADAASGDAGPADAAPAAD